LRAAARPIADIAVGGVLETVLVHHEAAYISTMVPLFGLPLRITGAQVKQMEPSGFHGRILLLLVLALLHLHLLDHSPVPTAGHSQRVKG